MKNSLRIRIPAMLWGAIEWLKNPVFAGKLKAMNHIKEQERLLDDSAGREDACHILVDEILHTLRGYSLTEEDWKKANMLPRTELGLYQKACDSLQRRISRATIARDELVRVGASTKNADIHLNDLKRNFSALKAWECAIRK